MLSSHIDPESEMLSMDGALEILSNESAEIDALVLLGLSGPDSADRERFADAFAALSPERRRQAIAAMVVAAEDHFDLDYNDLYRVCLKDADPQVRRQAIEGLWEDERASLVRPLLRLLQDDADSGVRAAAAAALGRFVFKAECDALDAPRAAAVREALERTIANPREDMMVACRAIESLSYINDESVRQIIDRAYASDDPLMQASAVFAMGRSADPFWAETVLAELHSDMPEMRFEAARASGELQLGRSVKRLIGMIGDRDPEVRGMAVWALGQIGGDEAKEAINACVESDDEVLCEAAEEALQEIEFAAKPLDLIDYKAGDDADDGYDDADMSGFDPWSIMHDDLDDADTDADLSDNEEERWSDTPLDLN